jgi:hypothetical protein
MTFFIPIFHVQAHGGNCLRLYHPRRAPDLGLVDGECCERAFAYMGKFSYTTRNMSPQNRRDQLESSLLFLRERSLQGIAKKQVKKLQDISKKKEQAHEIFLGYRNSGETDEELETRAENLYNDYTSEPSSPANAADKLASDYA